MEDQIEKFLQETLDKIEESRKAPAEGLECGCIMKMLAFKNETSITSKDVRDRFNYLSQIVFQDTVISDKDKSDLGTKLRFAKIILEKHSSNSKDGTYSSKHDCVILLKARYMISAVKERREEARKKTGHSVEPRLNEINREDIGKLITEFEEQNFDDINDKTKHDDKEVSEKSAPKQLVEVQNKPVAVPKVKKEVKKVKQEPKVRPPHKTIISEIIRHENRKNDRVIFHVEWTGYKGVEDTTDEETVLENIPVLRGYLDRIGKKAKKTLLEKFPRFWECYKV